MMILLPRAAAKLKAFAEVVTATHDRAIEIRQDAGGAVITASDGHQLCRITAPPPEGMVPTKVEPFLVDARAFAKAAAEVGCSRTETIVSADPQHVAAQDRPLVVALVDDPADGERKRKVACIAGPEGQPQTIGLVYGAMPDCARVIDVIRGEATVIGTKAAARLDPRLLQNVADLAVALGLGSIEVAFAPRLNYVMAEGAGPDGCTVQFAIAGIGEIDFKAIDARPRPAWEVDDALTLTMPEAKPRATAKRKPKPKDAPLFMDDLPF